MKLIIAFLGLIRGLNLLFIALTQVLFYYLIHIPIFSEAGITPYLNQRLFSYDALSEHASKEELKILLASNKLSLWSLGLLTGLVQFMPVLNLFAPTLTALAFIHFELARLENYRHKSNSDSSQK